MSMPGKVGSAVFRIILWKVVQFETSQFRVRAPFVFPLLITVMEILQNVLTNFGKLSRKPWWVMNAKLDQLMWSDSL